MGIYFCYDTYKGIIKNGKLFHQATFYVNDASFISLIMKSLRVRNVYSGQKYY